MDRRTDLDPLLHELLRSRLLFDRFRHGSEPIPQHNIIRGLASNIERLNPTNMRRTHRK